MKESLRSIIRHALTGVGSFVSYLLKQGWITAEEAAELAPALDKLLDVAAVIIGAVVSRLIILWLGKTDFGKAVAERLGLMLLCGFTAVGLGVSLPSCSVLEGVDADGRIYYRDAGSGAKGGIDLVPGKKPAWWVRLPGVRRGSADGTGLQVEISPVALPQETADRPRVMNPAIVPAK